MIFGKEVRVFMKGQAKLYQKSLVKEGIQNLYRVELSNFWRMLYTIEGTQVEILVFVLNIMNHKEYNKLFGYK